MSLESLKVPHIKVDISNTYNSEAYIGACPKWVKNTEYSHEAHAGVCDKWVKSVNVNGKARRIWIKTGAIVFNTHDHASLGETIASCLAEDLGIPNVLPYRLCIVEYKEPSGQIMKTFGCYSYDFTAPDEETVSIQDMTGIHELRGVDGYNKLIDIVKSETDIDTKEFTRQLDYTLLLDSVIMNYDRHLGNIAVIRNTKTGHFRMSPIFDMGYCLGVNGAWDMDGVYDDDWEMNSVISYPVHPFSEFHENQMLFTQFMRTEQGITALKTMGERSIHRTLRYINTIYQKFGFDYETNWTEQQRNYIDSVREHVEEPLLLPEKKFMLALIKRRMEIVFNGSKLDMLPGQEDYFWKPEDIPAIKY